MMKYPIKEEIERKIDEYFDPTFDFLERIIDTWPRTALPINLTLIGVFPLWCVLTGYVRRK